MARALQYKQTRSQAAALSHSEGAVEAAEQCPQTQEEALPTRRVG